MFKFKSLIVAAAVLALAVPAMASNFRVADQVYVPAAGALAGSSGSFFSDIFISNLSTDTINVSVIFANTENGTRANFPNHFQLGPNERRTFTNFVGSPTSQGGLGLSQVLGQLIFSGCRTGSTGCGESTQDPNTGFSANFRPIAVQSRIYSIPPGATLGGSPAPPTQGQLFSGYAWYHFVSQETSSIGLDRVFITGLTNNGTAGQAGTQRANIGLANASEFSNTEVVVKLFNGQTGQQLGSDFVQRLSPLGHVQVGLGNMFGAAGTGSNLYVTVEQRNSTSTADAPEGCRAPLSPGGCPGFFAYGSVLDNGSGDATTLEPMYTKSLTNEAITCIYAPTGNCKTAVTIRRAVRR